ncbi:hypothetical protein CF66_9046 [Candidatus Photodesmus katoptron]|nr:hypothetical protein CF66_9046 [Candidatus Photodesmus katoptron]
MMKNFYTRREKSRIEWACRRGMLELDIIITSFFENCFDELTQNEKRSFATLLEYSDPVLFSWIIGYSRSKNLEHALLVDKIISYNLNQGY